MIYKLVVKYHSHNIILDEFLSGSLDIRALPPSSAIATEPITEEIEEAVEPEPDPPPETDIQP